MINYLEKQFVLTIQKTHFNIASTSNPFVVDSRNNSFDSNNNFTLHYSLEFHYT